jgi:hypothetical protein
MLHTQRVLLPRIEILTRRMYFGTKKIMLHEIAIIYNIWLLAVQVGLKAMTMPLTLKCSNFSHHAPLLKIGNTWTDLHV